MANSNTPFGFRPVGTIGQSNYIGKVEKFFVPSTDTTAVGLGDPVMLAGSADADGVPTAKRYIPFDGTTASQCLGVMVSAAFDPTNLTSVHRPASTDRYIYVDTDPNTVYEVQETSTSSTNYIAATSVGLNGTMSLGTVDTTTGNSKTVISTTVATNTTYDVQILRLKPAVDNSIGQYAKWLVRLNQNQFRPSTIGQ